MTQAKPTKMITPAQREALAALARGVNWWQTPEQAMHEPLRFAARVMTYATWAELQLARRLLGDDLFRQTLDHPPAGIFDARSWHYWHHVFNKLPVPPLPRRQLP